ncbi:sigma-54-dependent transcriptional regulator [Breznakiellaceae bacterium SP9]
MAAILIIDDEPGIRKTLAAILEDERYTVFTAEDALAGIALLAKEAGITLVFLDVLLPRLGGLEALERIRRDFPFLEVIIISGHANIDMAVRAVKLGAFDFLEKPLSLDKVLTTCRNAFTLAKIRKENTELKKKLVPAPPQIVGTSPEIEEVRALIKQSAASDARILITGDNGTGKELVARAIHGASTRSSAPFVEVNCAAIPDTLIESELFGHEKGAFTDAVAVRKGRFELADGGTLFLDEIADMSLMAQAKVLRVIQEQRLERVGGEKTIDVNVRLIAATNKNLVKEVEAGRFRQDLFFRLNVIPIYIPPLHERSEDILLLFFYFLKSFEAEQITFEDAALQLLLTYEWPGNIRELRNFAERVAVMHKTDCLDATAVWDLLQRYPGLPSNKAAPGVQEQTPVQTQPLLNTELLELRYTEAKEAFEKIYLTYQLSRNDGVISKTADAIGVYPSNLHSKLRKFQLGTKK